MFDDFDEKMRIAISNKKHKKNVKQITKSQIKPGKNQAKILHQICNETLRTKFKTFSLNKRDFDFGRPIGKLAEWLSWPRVRLKDRSAIIFVCVFPFHS